MSGEDSNVMGTVVEEESIREDNEEEEEEEKQHNNADDKLLMNPEDITPPFYGGGGEETASSSHVDDGDDDDDEDEEMDDEGEDEDSSWSPDDVMASMHMPLFKYVRLTGSLPRLQKQQQQSSSASSLPPPQGSKVPQNCLAASSTCAAIGRVIVSPVVSSIMGGSNNPLATALDTSKHGDDNLILLQQRKMLTDATPHYIMMMGFETGKLCMVDIPTGLSILVASSSSSTSDPLHIREGKPQEHAPSVVDVSFDATGSVAGAIDREGNCAIWELKYSTTTSTSTTTRPATASTGTSATTSFDTPPPHAAAAVASENVFTSLMSAWTMPGPPKLTNVSSTASEPPTRSEETTTTTPITTTTTAASTTSLRLAASVSQVARIAYPKSFGRPTCLAMDPGYKRKRDKCLLVGFADGRLILTKRGFFQRRNDAVIYQGTKTTDGVYLGIEEIAWRGPLVAWADASGIKLFDVDTQARIAQVDRPTGARPSLYPTVSSLKPSLCFETKDNLLVAWGDCLMNLSIRETMTIRNRTEAGASEGSASGGGIGVGGTPNPPTTVRRRKVECTMAWELDCVACGVSPLDAEHVLVFGLVPPYDEADVSDSHNAKPDEGNDLEIQVISRANGTVTYCDALPMARRDDEANVLESAATYHLLSSFALPRADDLLEADIEELQAVEDDVDMDMSSSLFGNPEQKIRFMDSHLKWNLKDVSYGEGDQKQDDHVVFNMERLRKSLAGSDGDSQSVDSDDYECVLRPNADLELDSPVTKATPPLLVFASTSDVVVARTRDVDDAVQHALSINKRALALRRGLFRRQQLKRYIINDLVNEYLRAVLRINAEQDSTPTEELSSFPRLSLRRLKLAAESTPILLGGDISMWKLWISEFARIPGGLFVLRDFVPVRDPKLPRHIYGKVLRGQLIELEKMIESATGDNATPPGVVRQTQDHFLDTLLAWGSTSALKVHIKFYKQYETLGQENGASNSLIQYALSKAEDALHRRYTQTAAGYLHLTKPQPTIKPSQPQTDIAGHAPDSLFDVEFLFKIIASRAPMIFDRASFDNEVVPSELINTQFALEALGRLSVMQGRFDNALKCYLAIGSLYCTPSLAAMEELAISEVNNIISVGSRQTYPIPHFAFVLAMIENKQLHQCLLDRFFVTELVDDDRFHPLLCLFQLVGLDLIGRFLLEHCVAPSVISTPVSVKSESNENVLERHESLPLDLVAEQLTLHPKLLYWYLHLILTCKPEVYTKFPNTANPPKAITDLHRVHLDLFLQYAGREKDSVSALEGMEFYKMDHKNTPLLLFLKAALPLGGIRIEDVRRVLEDERTNDKVAELGGFSHAFALELAFVIEQYGDNSEDDALRVLDLYVKGADSLMMAVSYAQRTRDHSSLLWDRLIDHCISSDKRDTRDNDAKYTGKKFGMLLEAAALSGADLAKLVTHIPAGMAVQGLRTRLVAAVADYRMKLKLHKVNAEIGTKEKIALLRELAHRSRRGMRYQMRNHLVATSLWPPIRTNDSSLSQNGGPSGNSETNALPKGLRTRERRDRYSLSFSLPMR